MSRALNLSTDTCKDRYVDSAIPPFGGGYDGEGTVPTRSLASNLGSGNWNDGPAGCAIPPFAEWDGWDSADSTRSSARMQFGCCPFRHGLRS